MLKLKNNTIFMEKPIKLTRRQSLRYEKLTNSEDQMDYLMSILGKRTRITHDDICENQKCDPLAEKRKNEIKTYFQNLLNNGSNANHKPIARLKGSQWVGVEIECYVSDEDECCEYCDNGRETCYNCEGSGEVIATDYHENEYTVECGSCDDGSGYRDCCECDGNGSSSDKKDEIRQALRDAKVTNVSVRDDGSLRGGGVEVCLLFDASKGFDKLQKVCKILNDFDARINTDCGLHVHLDYFGTDQNEIVSIGKHFQKFVNMLAKMQPKSRRENRYCSLNFSTNERYSAINLTAFSKHKTIEVRLHGGSTNFEKIKNWIDILILIKKNYKKGSTTPMINDFQDMIDVLKLPDTLTEYVDKRLQKFNPDYALDSSNCCDEVEEEQGEENAA